MPDPLYVNVDMRIFEESLLRILSDLEPDSHSVSGKRDMRIKSEVDGMLSYLKVSTPLLDQSAYPVPKSRR